MEHILHNSGVWVLFSFLIFAVFAWKFGKDSALKSLDSGIDAIRRDVESARALREQAQELLAQYEKKKAESMAESEAILARARDHAERIRRHAETTFAESLACREAALAERIRRMEESALQEIREHSARLSVAATRRLLLDRIDEATGLPLADRAVEDVLPHLAH